MSAQTLTINGRTFPRPGHAPAPRRKWCKFCCGRNLAAATCNYSDGLGHVCGAGICERHSLHLDSGQVRCPHHNPKHGVYEEVA